MIACVKKEVEANSSSNKTQYQSNETVDLLDCQRVKSPGKIERVKKKQKNSDYYNNDLIFQRVFKVFMCTRIVKWLD